MVNTCVELTDYLQQQLVGCDSSEPLGVTSPMSASFWCQQLDYRPLRDVYHDVTAPLVRKTPAASRRHERKYVRPRHPNSPMRAADVPNTLAGVDSVASAMTRNFEDFTAEPDEESFEPSRASVKYVVIDTVQPLDAD